MKRSFRRRRCGPTALLLMPERHPGRRVVVYRGRLRAHLLLVFLIAASVTAGLLSGMLLVAAGALGLVVLGWLAYAVRVLRIVPSGPGNGPGPPGGAGVREPRRPLPHSPGGAAERPLPDEDPYAGIALA